MDSPRQTVTLGDTQAGKQNFEQFIAGVRRAKKGRLFLFSLPGAAERAGQIGCHFWFAATAKQECGKLRLTSVGPQPGE